MDSGFVLGFTVFEITGFIDGNNEKGGGDPGCDYGFGQSHIRGL